MPRSSGQSDQAGPSHDAAVGADADYADVCKQNICPFDLGQGINYQGKWEQALFFSLLQLKNSESEKSTFQWPQLVSEAIIPTNSISIWEYISIEVVLDLYFQYLNCLNQKSGKGHLHLLK